MNEHGSEKQLPALGVGQVNGGLVPTNLASLWRMSQMIAKSGLAPKGMDTPEKIAGAVGMGMELGLSPFQAVQSIAVINGRPSVWGDAMLALVEASGQLEDMTEEPLLDKTDAVTGYRCRVKRLGRSWRESVYTVEMARKAGLWGKAGPWASSPARMLQMRARGFALRDVFPDALKGLVSREEARDIPPRAPEEAEYEAIPTAEALTEALRGEVPAAPAEPAEALVLSPCPAGEAPLTEAEKQAALLRERGEA